MPPPDPPSEGDPWNPWRALRDRPHIIFRMHPVAGLLGGGIYARRGNDAAVVLDPSLPRRSRRVALAHELVHDEWGGGCDHESAPLLWNDVVARHEEAVNREVTRRLVPPATLRSWAEARAELGEPLEVWEVAERYDVDHATAERALDGLA